MVWKCQSLYKWHTNRNVVPNEKKSEKDIKRVGYFEYHKNKWWLVNEKMNSLYMIENNGADNNYFTSMSSSDPNTNENAGFRVESKFSLVNITSTHIGTNNNSQLITNDLSSNINATN